jgi:TatD DNase family protein
MFIDTHCHLDMIARLSAEPILLTDADFLVIKAAVDQAHKVRVEKIINVGTSIQGSLTSIDIAKRYSSVFATIGVHPCDSVTHDLKKSIVSLRGMLDDKERNKIVALGEIGLDFFHKPFDKQKQYDFLKAQVELALEYDVPVVLHVREAADELLRVIEEYVKNGLKGVFHCFLQKSDFAEIILAWGFYVGLDAPITYPKNDELRSLFKTIPLARVVLETDAPFLPPQQFRGKQNRSEYIPLIAQALADIRDVDVSEIERTTTYNAEALFSLSSR